ncbi:endonuclease/exonuclease/phosphatase family protein [Aminivibrio sp.]|uniref:endonuclease/exonuclease/phosphatase family protein n=1 Tax=Aminivibrio sp. TaxID=1872489 RepID=UPI001A557E23|nr:endonuclease/exonuclease/phosphatase family protein [Aminivibrio sp.]MBL3538996.1 endonuclease [Aminivibrio sp.]
MRLVLYNIRYGTGTGWGYHFPFPFSGCLRKTEGRFRRISDFISKLKPDLVGLVETDSGSYRQNGECQAELMAARLNADSVFACKYHHESIISRAPLLKSQGNAVVTILPILSSREHYLSRGVKRTLLEVEFRDFTLFLTHLSLGYGARKIQIGEVADRCRQAKKPVILAGDGNMYAGEKELRPLFRKGLFRNANDGNIPTYPSRLPSLALDFVLYSEGIEMKSFRVPRVRYSDHLPLVCDFTAERQDREALAS